MIYSTHFIEKLSDEEIRDRLTKAGLLEKKVFDNQEEVKEYITQIFGAIGFISFAIGFPRKCPHWGLSCIKRNVAIIHIGMITQIAAGTPNWRHMMQEVILHEICTCADLKR